MIDLEGKTALITGGARGIGAAVALRLAEAGSDVIINYLTSRGAAGRVADRIAQMGRKVAVVKGDVNQLDDIREMSGFIKATFGNLDILIHSAAAGGFRPLMETRAVHFESALNTNARSLILLVQEFLQMLSAGNGRGKVVAISSHGAHFPIHAYGAIGASKAALESLVRHLALEVGRKGVNLNVVTAGLVDTDSTRQMPHFPERAQKARRLSLVGDALVTARDVADTVVYLASALSNQIQGQRVIVDAGVGIASYVA